MTYNEFIEDLYDSAVERCNLKGVEKDIENSKRDDGLLDMISIAMTEKYGSDKALDIINEQFDTQCKREYPYQIGAFKVAIQIGFMLAKLVYEIE